MKTNTPGTSDTLFNFTSWACPLCGMQSTSHSIGTKDYNHGIPGNFTFVKCTKCRLWRQEPRPDDASLGNAYPLHYGSSSNVKNNPDSRIHCYANRKRFHLAQSLRKNGATIFDIGCGSGFFLAFLREKGWQVAGIDSAPEHVEYANERLGLADVATARWPGFDNGNRSYDFVSLIHVLEHLPDPIEGLRAAATMLKPGGHLLIETPNINAFARYIFGGRCNLFDAPRHLCLFSPSTLRACAESAGLTTARLITYSPALDGYIESLRYFLKDAHFRRYPDKRAALAPDDTEHPDCMAHNHDNKRTPATVTLSHTVERCIDRCIDTAASSCNGGLTLLSLLQKG